VTAGNVTPSGPKDCQVLTAVAVDGRLHVLAQAPGAQPDGAWSLDNAYHLSVTSLDGTLTFGEGSTGETGVEPATINALYRIEYELGEVLDMALEKGGRVIQQARLVRVITL